MPGSFAIGFATNRYAPSRTELMHNVNVCIMLGITDKKVNLASQQTEDSEKFAGRSKDLGSLDVRAIIIR
jgi:hypothetical protein